MATKDPKAMWRVYINVGSMNADYKTVIAKHIDGAYQAAVKLFRMEDPDFHDTQVHKIEMLGRED